VTDPALSQVIGVLREAADVLPRIVCQFSCGAASAVATKLALSKFGATRDVQIINAFVQEEHPDNRRFLADCEKWFGRQVTVLADKKYGASTLEVFRREQFMKSRYGAPCSKALKRKVLDAWRQPGDQMVIGFTAEEVDRFESLQERLEYDVIIAPLIESGLTKADCLAIIERAGIELPMMYKLGYSNANCIGCVKGGVGYWNKIKTDFPIQFEAIAKVQDAIGEGAYFNEDQSTGKRYSLRDLKPGTGRHSVVLPACSFFCEMAEQDIKTTC
jgi:hypothetical protein